MSASGIGINRKLLGGKKPKAEKLFFEHERTFVSLSFGRE